MDSESEEKKAFNLALRRLASKESCSSEIIEYLKKKGISSESIRTTLDRLEQEKLLDDSRYARLFTRSLGLQGKGPMHIVSALRKKGIQLSLSQAKTLLQNEIDSWDEVSLAKKIIARRYPEAKNDPKMQNRAFQALLRRGFSPEIIKKCLGTSADDDEC